MEAQAPQLGAAPVHHNQRKASAAMKTQHSQISKIVKANK